MDPVPGPAGGNLVNICRSVALARSLVASCLVIGCLVAGCSGMDAGSNEQPRRVKAPIPAPSVTGAAACFYPGQVQDFRVLDRSNLIVYAPNDRHAYHVRISPPSMELSFTDRLAFLSSSDRICGYAGERLVIGGSTAGYRVAIIAVSRLSPESLESLRGGSAGIIAPSAEPQPGAGAEIEGAPVSEADSKIEK